MMNNVQNCDSYINIWAHTAAYATSWKVAGLGLNEVYKVLQFT
jgi:hypothetical protein